MNWRKSPDIATAVTLMLFAKPDMVLFDLDGTLVDSVPDLAYSIDAMLEEIGMPIRGEDKVRHWVGNGLERLVERALTDDMDAKPEPALFERAYPVFMSIYAENACRQTRFYEGVESGLAFLKQHDINMGCVTNKREQFTHILLKSLGIFDDFGIVVSGDTLVRKKPDPMPLLHAAEHFNACPENSLMVGDSFSDVKAARAAGFQVICVSYGYNHGVDINIANPDAVIHSLADLPQVVNVT